MANVLPEMVNFRLTPFDPYGPFRTPRPCCNCSDLRMKLYKGMSSLEVRLQRYSNGAG